MLGCEVIKNAIKILGNGCKSPNVGNANNVRLVNPTGANDNNNANNSNGVAPDLSISQHKVSQS